ERGGVMNSAFILAKFSPEWGIVLAVMLSLFSGVGVDSSTVEAAEQSELPLPSTSPPERKNWWAALNFGGGSVSQAGGGIREKDTLGFLGVEGGIVVHPQFLLGIELSGWLVEESNTQDPSVGEGIMQAFLTTRTYPIPDIGLFVKLGGGYVSHWNNRPGEPRRLNGWGVTLGGGYDVLIIESLPVLPYVTPFVTYGFGEAGDLNHHAITGGIGLTVTGKGK
ncbi:hypothetical protein, partial [Petrachloros mirabilis]